MKTRLCFLLLLTLATSPALAAPGTADASFWCMSVRFQTGHDQWQIYTLNLTTGDPYGTPNGELAPDYTGAYTHSSQFVMDDGTGFLMPGNIGLDAPLDPDANDNGFPDFFEVSQGISATTVGRYSIPGVINNASVSAQWNRAAGSTRGTCVLTLQSMNTFSHTFDIIEFKGPLTYSPGASKVTVSMELPETGNPENRIGGQLQFTKSTADPFNTLYLEPGSLTNSATETLLFYDATFDRDLSWPTNYYGYVELDNDGDYNTYYPYALYLLSIDDMNDVDHDTIPDFSDNASQPPPRSPSLKLSLDGATLSLTISGDMGRSHRIEQARGWPAIGWDPVQTVTLTTDPQVVTLALPQNSPAFWRVVAQ